jgi:transcriptional regulator with XRE-family HTH domain
MSHTIVYGALVLMELGRALNRARESSQQSLEGVARPAKISAAYLHKLERGQVKTPSPRVLARLAGVLGVPYLRLMQLAGYLDAAQAAEVAGRPPEPHPLRDFALTPDEWRALGDFVKALKARRTKT